jgi:hypothetical protein
VRVRGEATGILGRPAIFGAALSFPRIVARSRFCNRPVTAADKTAGHTGRRVTGNQASGAWPTSSVPTLEKGVAVQELRSAPLGVDALLQAHDVPVRTWDSANASDRLAADLARTLGLQRRTAVVAQAGSGVGQTGADRLERLSGERGYACRRIWRGDAVSTFGHGEEKTPSAPHVQGSSVSAHDCTGTP